jgi:hypothetical protein
VLKRTLLLVACLSFTTFFTGCATSVRAGYQRPVYVDRWVRRRFLTTATGSSRRTATLGIPTAEAADLLGVPAQPSPIGFLLSERSVSNTQSAMVGEGLLGGKETEETCRTAIIEQRITGIERVLASSRVADAGREPTGISKTDKAESVNTPVHKRPLSAEARERIATAQRKRWAAKKKATKKATKKRAA